MYSQGSSEKILGRALKDFADRDDIVIATKVRHPMRPGPNGKGLSRKAIMTEIDHSLRRTQIDDAVASLDIDLTDDEAAALEAHYTPRHGFQGISDDAEFARIVARIPGFTPAGA